MHKVAAIASVLLAFGLSTALSYTHAPLAQPRRSRPLSASPEQIKKRKEELLDEFFADQEQKARDGRENVMRRNGLKPFQFGIHTVWAIDEARAEKKFKKQYQNPC